MWRIRISTWGCIWIFCELACSPLAEAHYAVTSLPHLGSSYFTVFAIASKVANLISLTRLPL